MNSNITTNNILKKTPSADTFAFWLNTLPTKTVSKLFGEKNNAILKATQDFQLANPVDMQQILLEIPLQNSACTDISFSYNTKNLQNNFFPSIAGQKIMPLFRYLTLLLPQNNNVYIELDTGKGNNTIPSIYFDCTNHEKIIFSKLWLKNMEPPQWQYAEQLVNNLPENWCLLYLGLMPGRPNSPLRIIFTKTTVNGQHLPCSCQDIDILLEAIYHKPLTTSIKEKIKHLTDLNFPEITVSLNLLPNNEFDNLLGIEVFVPEENTNPEETLTTSRGKKLLKTLTDWQMADERVKLLNQCCGICFPPQFPNCAEAQIQSFLNHIKLQWEGEKVLPAKAYIACNSYFR